MRKRYAENRRIKRYREHRVERTTRRVVERNGNTQQRETTRTKDDDLERFVRSLSGRFARSIKILPPQARDTSELY